MNTTVKFCCTISLCILLSLQETVTALQRLPAAAGVCCMEWTESPSVTIETWSTEADWRVLHKSCMLFLTDEAEL